MYDDQIRTDFERARHRAFFHDLLAVVGRRSNDLIPFHEVRRRYSPEGESYRGYQTVPVAKIVGSVDRFHDFDREFLPRHNYTRGRWQNVDRAYYQDVRLPPIQLYKVGEVYFVKDGNHRVSVARERGVEFIDGEVIESHIRVPLYASMTPKELLLQVEYAEFLRRTNLDKLRPEHDIRPTALGRYDEIWEQIEEHRVWWSGELGRPVGTDEAAGRWYDEIYLPIIEVARQRGIPRRFPDRTEADIYLWVMAHREALRERYGRDLDPAAATADYARGVSRRNPLRWLGDLTRAALKSLTAGNRDRVRAEPVVEPEE
ncbi:MAG: hypothetical protein ACRDJW_07480 [Thermomicrobiales bacterium]